MLQEFAFQLWQKRIGSFMFTLFHIHFIYLFIYLFYLQLTMCRHNPAYNQTHSYIYKNMLIMSTFKGKKHYSLIRNIFQWKHPHYIETSQPIRLANQLTGFYMIRVKTNKMTKLLLNQVLAFLQQHEGSSCQCKSILSFQKFLERNKTVVIVLFQ